MNAHEARQSEEARQVVELSRSLKQIIDIYIEALPQAGREANPRGIAGAIVQIQATFLASIPDREARKQLRRVMEKSLPVSLAQILAAQEKAP